MSLKSYLVKNRETAQLIYGILLIIMIPLLILFNTIYIINKYNSNLDISLQRQALTVGRSIYSLTKDHLDSAEILEANIYEMMEKSGDIKKLEILKPKGNNFVVIASSDSDSINTEIDFNYYRFAMMQPDKDGLVTDSLRQARDVNSEKLFGEDELNDRYWLVAMPIYENGVAKAVLSLKMSSKIVDDLTHSSRNASLFLLAITILIVVLFLLVATRLWDYAILYNKIKEVDQMKDEFISIASHELRTPVTGIRGYTSMMLDGSYGKISDKMVKGLKMISGASERLAILVEDLLNVSRIEQGRMQFDLEKLSLEPIIEETIEELSVQAEIKKLKLNYTKPAQALPQVKIDKNKFKQVLINIIGNSIKYTENGSIDVKIEALPNNSNLKISVKDTGIGMSSEERARLFEKFYRIQNDKTLQITGTGLGLWITKKIVEAMNGKINVESMKGVGSEFSIIFPISR